MVVETVVETVVVETMLESALSGDASGPYSDIVRTQSPLSTLSRKQDGAKPLLEGKEAED